MSMPIELVLVRHGESEANVASRAYYHGRTDEVPQDYLKRHASKWRLTPAGREQAQSAGKWIKNNINNGIFTHHYVSTYLRALETASLLRLPAAEWQVRDDLREQDGGHFDCLTREERHQRYPEVMAHRQLDPYYWSAPGGESMANVQTRVASGIFNTLQQSERPEPTVIVGHGGVMWAMRMILEEQLPDEYLKLHDYDSQPLERIKNCQILHYSRRNPETGQIAPSLNWMRSVCPWDESLSPNVWQPINHKTYSNQALLGLVNKLSS